MTDGPVQLQGEKKLNVLLRHMRITASNRAASAGLKKGGQLLAKKVKADVPSRYKTVRKAIGWKKVRKKTEVKVGGSVGKKKKGGQPVERGKKSGVGISARNVNWWYIGTKERTQTTTGKSTGKMDPQAIPVSTTAANNMAGIKSAIAEGTWKGIKKEIAKGKAFA